MSLGNYKGKPIEQLTREELIEALSYAMKELHRLQQLPIDYDELVTRRMKN